MSGRAASTCLTHFGRFVAAFGGSGFANGTVFGLEGFAAVAMWIPPGAEPDGDAIVAALSQSVPGAKQADTFSVLEQMETAHPKERHWYLPWLGGDSARQGAGLGAELLRHGLARLDADHLPAFLETPKPADGVVLGASRIRGVECLAGRSVAAGYQYAPPSRPICRASAERGHRVDWDDPVERNRERNRRFGQ